MKGLQFERNGLFKEANREYTSTAEALMKRIKSIYFKKL